MSDRLTIIQADCVAGLRSLPAKSVQLIVTSPPYYGLRDYKIPTSVWGGDLECEHLFEDVHVRRENRRGLGLAASPASTRGGAKKIATVGWQDFVCGFCSKCDAWRGVFGLEPTLDLYIEHAILIFREARRVLRDDGTLWINLGDSFANDTKWGGATGGKHARGVHGDPIGRSKRKTGLKAGDLMGMPWRVAFALQADGWYLRRDNIWAKDNPMPESVDGWRWERHRVKVAPSARAVDRSSHALAQSGVNGPHGAREGRNFADHSSEYVECPGCQKCEPNGGLILRKGNWRCTTSHEYVFQFAKSDSYFCDAQAARGVGTSGPSDQRKMREKKDRIGGKNKTLDDPLCRASGLTNIGRKRSVGDPGSRNKRSVWRIPTKPFRGAHFATFPPDLVRPIIAAASPVKCCIACEAPWAPIVARGKPRAEQQRACGGDRNGHYNGTAQKEFALHGAQDASAVKARILAGMVEKVVIGYRPTCLCGVEGSKRPVVLDMFGGSGTVGQVANELGRDAILIEISGEYIPLIERRCHVTPPLAMN